MPAGRRNGAAAGRVRRTPGLPAVAVGDRGGGCGRICRRHGVLPAGPALCAPDPGALAAHCCAARAGRHLVAALRRRRGGGRALPVWLSHRRPGAAGLQQHVLGTLRGVQRTNLQKSGLNVLIQADWMEQTPLGKAEWIKLYGALYGKEKEAKTLFDGIVKNYNDAIELVANKKPTATVLYGAMYQDQWYVARGNSWVAQFMKDAKANYLWSNVAGTGSLSMPFEKILEKAKTAKYWIATGSFKNSAEFENSNPHYSQFDASKSKNVYTFESKLGATGGTIYYELAASRPDLVLKDYIKIFHPELLPNYTFTFAQKLN